MGWRRFAGSKSRTWYQEDRLISKKEAEDKDTLYNNISNNIKKAFHALHFDVLYSLQIARQLKMLFSRGSSYLNELLQKYFWVLFSSTQLD